MLNQEYKLFFPFLLYLKKHVSFAFNIYKLDWTKQNELLECKINKLVSSLPGKYEELVAGLLFGLKSGCVVELRRCVRAAIDEFNLYRQVDGDMQDICLKPGVAYVETAFRLLADSILDESTEYYTRDYTLKTIAFHAMLYKFWCYQTTKEHIYENAGLYNLAQASRVAQKIEHTSTDLDRSTYEINKFLDAIKKHQNYVLGENHV